jgi:hypothetical protein
MVSSRSSVLRAVLAAVVLLPAVACDKPTTPPPTEQGDDDVDRTAKTLLAQLQLGDPAELAEQFPGPATETLDERNVVVIARTLTWLGTWTEFKRQAEQPVVGGVERRYAITLERGELELSITIVDGKLEGFAFEPSLWDAHVDSAAEAAAGSMRVSQFRYVDRQGKPTTGPLDPTAVNYELVLEGLGAVLREHHVAVHKLVFDSAGNEVYRQWDDDEVRFSQAETGASGGRISGTVAVPGPGQYELQLDIRDIAGEQSMTHRVPFTIEEAPPPAARKGRRR